MSREPIVSTHHDAEGALSDDELDSVVGGTAGTCIHGSTTRHSYEDASGLIITCYRTTDGIRLL